MATAWRWPPEAFAALADFAAQALRELREGVLEAGAADCLQQVGVAHVAGAEQDVLADVAMEQHHVLGHIADLAAQAEGSICLTESPSISTAPWSGL